MILFEIIVAVAGLIVLYEAVCWLGQKIIDRFTKSA